MEQLTATEARNNAAITIECEGIGYAVQDYCGPKTFEADLELALLWASAGMALGRLETYLALNAGEQTELSDRTADVNKLVEDFFELVDDASDQFREQWNDTLERMKCDV